MCINNNMFTKLQMTPKNGASESHIIVLVSDTDKTIWRGFVNYKKGCTRFAAASDKVYQLLAHGQ